MKRKALILAAAVALAMGACGAALWAQQPGAPTPQPTAPATTRVAMINLNLVMENYEKTKIIKQEQENIFKPMKEKLDSYLKAVTQWKEALKNPSLAAPEREKGEKAIRDYQRLAEDLQSDMRKVLGKKAEEQIIQLYREVEDGVKRYALANGFNIVLNFGEIREPSMVYSLQNIERKMQAVAQSGCCSPIFIAPGLDITTEVLTNLNAPYRAAGGPSARQPSGH